MHPIETPLQLTRRRRMSRLTQRVHQRQVTRRVRIATASGTSGGAGRACTPRARPVDAPVLGLAGLTAAAWPAPPRGEHPNELLPPGSHRPDTVGVGLTVCDSAVGVGRSGPDADGAQGPHPILHQGVHRGLRVPPPPPLLLLLQQLRNEAKLQTSKAVEREVVAAGTSGLEGGGVLGGSVGGVPRAERAVGVLVLDHQRGEEMDRALGGARGLVAKGVGCTGVGSQGVVHHCCRDGPSPVVP